MSPRQAVQIYSSEGNGVVLGHGQAINSVKNHRQGLQSMLHQPTQGETFVALEHVVAQDCVIAYDHVVAHEATRCSQTAVGTVSRRLVRVLSVGSFGHRHVQ